MGCGEYKTSAGTEKETRTAVRNMKKLGRYEVKCPVCGEINTKKEHCSDFVEWDLKTNNVTFKRELVRR